MILSLFPMAGHARIMAKFVGLCADKQKQGSGIGSQENDFAAIFLEPINELGIIKEKEGL